MLLDLSTKKISGMRTYRRKPLVVLAKQVDEPFMIHTVEGVIYGHSGDYLVIGPKLERYIVDCDVFNDSHDEVKK